MSRKTPPRGWRDAELAAPAVAARLTDRDRYLVRMVGRHRVFTTGQLADMAFDSLTRARARLGTLQRLGLLERFRPHRPVGSAPWHYVLGAVGAALLETEDRDIGGKWRAQIRSDRLLSLERSQRLGHMTGVNGFFSRLIRNQRHGRGQLREWLNENDASHRFLPAWEVVRPDGFAVWAEDARESEFYLEYDTGSENLTRLVAKLDDYAELARILSYRDQNAGDRRFDIPAYLPLVLFCFAGTRRETSARQALKTHREWRDLRIATATVAPDDANPADDLWLPLDSDSGPGMRLSALGEAIPSPSPDPRPPRPWARDPDDEFDEYTDGIDPDEP
jgi:hypothetical protein